MNVGLIGGGYGHRGEAETGRPLVFKVQPTINASSFERWGQTEWRFYGFRVDGPDDTVGTEITGSLPVDVRPDSTLSIATTVAGGAVKVTGQSQAYNTVRDRYVPWSGQAVTVQRWSGSEWVRVDRVPTDARGKFTSTVRVPAGSTLRAYVKDAPKIWGAVSATAKV